MFCTQCGLKIKPSWLFCRNCGAKLSIKSEGAKGIKAFKRAVQVTKKIRKTSKVITKRNRQKIQWSRAEIWDTYKGLPQAGGYSDNDNLRIQKFLFFLNDLLINTEDKNKRIDLKAWIKEINRPKNKLSREAPLVNRGDGRPVFESAIKTDIPMHATKYAK